jgi:hypothetical protein
VRHPTIDAACDRERRRAPRGCSSSRMIEPFSDPTSPMVLPDSKGVQVSITSDSLFTDTAAQRQRKASSGEAPAQARIEALRERPHLPKELRPPPRDADDSGFEGGLRERKINPRPSPSGERAVRYEERAAMNTAPFAVV